MAWAMLYDGNTDTYAIISRDETDADRWYVDEWGLPHDVVVDLVEYRNARERT